MQTPHEEPANPRGTLPIILIAAVVQGWALYGLHLAVNHHTWPATAPGWLLASYTLATFTPLTVQLLASRLARLESWAIVAILATAFFYFGWHHGASVSGESTTLLVERNDAFPLALLLLILWLLLMPFIQCRLASGTWRAPYTELFATAWRNKLLLAEAAIFTGLFWFLLMLWQMLFDMLGIGFFKALFREPIFVYPVTSLTFGVALHLIGSVDRLTSVLLEQVLSVLKWLAVVAGLILALFSMALLLKLPGLVFEGQRAIGAAWLLWLLAVIVLLVNAAYRDGTVTDPYPRWLGLALRVVVPLTVLIALTALYALYVRVGTYGFTVERVWAFVVASAALVYAVGYAAAATRRIGWMSGISRVNVGVALGLIAVIALTLTPVLSPYRIAANSQYRLALTAKPQPAAPNQGRQSTPFQYLKFETGRYGAAKLQTLMQLEDHPRAAQIRELAKSAFEQENRWMPPGVTPSDVDQLLAELVIHPQGQALDPPLKQRLVADLRKPNANLVGPREVASSRKSGVFVDLNGDGVDEFVLLLGGNGWAYEQRADDWQQFGTLAPSGGPWNEATEAAALRGGDVGAQVPQWKELRIGRTLYRVTDIP